MQKFILAVSILAGLVLAVPALAAALVPVPSGTQEYVVTGSAAQIVPAGNTGVSGQAMPTTGWGQNNIMMPCAQPMMLQNSAGSGMGSGNMMYRTAPNPCGQMLFSRFMGPFAGGREVAWLGLMFVMTVILVWVALLLLIALLWKLLQKHKHS